MVVITADGMENAGRRYSLAKVREMIERQRAKYGWEFIFPGANMDAVHEAGKLGIDAESSMNFRADSEGVRANSEAAAMAVGELRVKGARAIAWREHIERTSKKEDESMLGAIIGDIVGSRFEFHNRRNKGFDLFAPRCRSTDDSIMTLAVAQALMEAGENAEALPGCAVRWMQELGREYPHCGFGGMFRTWIHTDDPQPYGSYGNGAAMRVSPVGFYAGSEDEVRRLSHAVTAVSHDHPEGLKGAEATAMAIYLARTGMDKAQIRERIERDYYRIDFTLDEIRPTYQFNETCQNSVPQALEAFFESESFEDAIRNAVSIGGDSDTIAAIAGGIAEAYYGIPEEIARRAEHFVPRALLDILKRWREFMKQREEE